MNSLAAVLFVSTISLGDVLGSYYHGPTAVPHVLHDGYLADTYEVAAAKSAHLATLSSQSHGNHDLSYHGHHRDSRYNEPIAVPHVLPNGHIADTHEVAAAKAEHFGAVAKAHTHHHDYNGQYAAGYDHYSGASGAYHGYGAPGGYPHYSEDSGASHGYVAHGWYHGPLAKPVVLPSSYLADTHEVAAIKDKHEISHANQHHSHSSI